MKKNAVPFVSTDNMRMLLSTKEDDGEYRIIIAHKGLSEETLINEAVNKEQLLHMKEVIDLQLREDN